MGQVMHSMKAPTEHLTESAAQVVTPHCESMRGACTCACTGVYVGGGGLGLVGK